MRLKITCLALLASLAACLGTAAIAAAASGPTVTATKATAITNTSAEIHATINPNGAKTTYYFSYGPTTALGTNSPQKALPAVSKAKAVDFTVSHLSSGTTYDYNLTAVNVAGTAVTKTLTFTTSGHAPAQATTGGATVQSSTSVTFTGTINTQDVNTDYYFVYGTTTGYGQQTATAVETASPGPSAVSTTVTGLTPGTVFYYALVAVNGANDLSTGATASVETFPSPVPTPKVVASTSPKTAKHGPYTLTSRGRIEYTNKTNPGLACAGTAEASYYSGKKLVYRQAVPTDAADCTFTVTTLFKSLPVKHHTTEQLRVFLRFSGNHYFKGVLLGPELVTLG